MHLSAADLVDLAEGARPESSAPHLTTCAACRIQLAELRATMAAAAEADVPEPSPLFWEHLSRRVHDAVAAERPGGLRWNWLPVYSLAGAALLAVIVFTGVRIFVRSPQPAPSATALQTRPAPLAALDQDDGAEAADAWRGDVWLTFVADLAAGIDADAARDEGLDALNADEAVMHLSEGELRELERLLQAQIRESGD
ncbi:MAG TPA: hypothetical protein VKE51_27085 [Vicinamibacterales bacterium]|nr:hypothetical protein [Vicinamibacterales bacterium]